MSGESNFLDCQDCGLGLVQVGDTTCVRSRDLGLFLEAKPWLKSWFVDCEYMLKRVPPQGSGLLEADGVDRVLKMALDHQEMTFQALDDEEEMFQDIYENDVYPCRPEEIGGHSTKNIDDWTMGAFSGDPGSGSLDAYLEHDESGFVVLAKITNGKLTELIPGVSSPLDLIAP